MSGKREVTRKPEPRAVTLRINGHEVSLNGYVMDVFQEVTLGLVRALGEENTNGEIELRIGPAVR